jgi:ribosomal protein S18 acetylase RimI-like enzyme
MDIVVRQVIETDFDQVGAVFLEELTYHAGLLPDRFQIADPIMTREWFDEILANANKTIIVAELDETIVGLVQLTLATNPDDPIFRPRKYVYVEDLAVAGWQRRQGIGRLLMAQARDWALAQGVSEIELDVWELNKWGISFYEALGYTTIRRKMRIVLGDPGWLEANSSAAPEA